MGRYAFGCADNVWARGKPRNPRGKIRDAEDLGQAIRKRRKKLGLTQVQLADACQCSPRFIGELERGVAGGNIKQVLYVWPVHRT